jgi:hypothetical protein
MRLDAPKNLVPWDAAGFACREGAIQFIRPGVDLAALWLGQREQVRITPEPLPQPVKKLELLLGRQGIQIDLAVCHGPFSLAFKERVQCRANTALSCEAPFRPCVSFSALLDGLHAPSERASRSLRRPGNPCVRTAASHDWPLSTWSLTGKVRRRASSRRSTYMRVAANTHCHAHVLPAEGNFLPNAPGSSTQPAPAARSASCCRFTRSRWAVRSAFTAVGSIVARSLSALPRLTMILCRAKSTSFTRRRQHSSRRRPDPYSSVAMSRGTPDSFERTARTSSRVSTTGRRVGPLARTRLSSHGKSRPRTFR